MSVRRFLHILKILLWGKNNLFMLLGIILGLSFSMSVILATLGIMDGFDQSIKIALQKLGGDCILQSPQGFIQDTPRLRDFLSSYPSIRSYRFFLKTQGFFLRGNYAQGVEIIAYAKKEKSLSKSKGTVIIGEELAKIQKLQVNDSIVLSYTKPQSSTNEIRLKSYRIEKIIHQGIYEKDLRTIYMDAADLQEEGDFAYSGISLLLQDPNKVDSFIKSVESDFSLRGLRLRPYYYEYGPLLSAVEMEKNTIGLLLHIIVVVCIFNFIAFIFYIREKKSQELFLFEALGLERKYLLYLWPFFSLLMMPQCIFGAFVFLSLFKTGLKTLPFLQMPGEIYHIKELQIVLDFSSYFLVFGLTTILILLITMTMSFPWRKASLLTQLRKGFS